MDKIQGKVFSDFEPPATTDGSYLGIKINSDATKKHLHMKLEQEIGQINEQLKANKTRVTIHSRKGSIQLRATLPLKPGDSHRQGKDKKQYTISLGIPASFDGLTTAREEAQELGKLIARQTFTWTDKYLGVQAKKKDSTTFRDFYEQFEKIYFSTRKRTIKSEHSFEKHIATFKSKLLSDCVINTESLNQAIQAIDSPARRKDVIQVARIVSNYLDIDINYSKLQLKYKPKKRNIPSDDTIVQCFGNFKQKFLNNRAIAKKLHDNWKIYQTIYGLLAVYGLRPREVFNQADLDWLISPENKYNTFKVHESNKTGYREIFPFVTEWIHLFDLKSQEMINLLKNYNETEPTTAGLRKRIKNTEHNFKSSGIEFTPYDLRHACAIRAHLQGMPIKAAADNLGHSPEMHTKVYQQWFGLENRRKAFEQTFNKINEIDALKDNLAQAETKIAQLEAELMIYKLKEMT